MGGYIYKKSTNIQWNESAFWRKLGRHAKQAGKRIVYVALLLYYVLVDPDTPMWAKTKCVAALLYFISPFNLIPDFLPGGYLDAPRGPYCWR